MPLNSINNPDASAEILAAAAELASDAAGMGSWFSKNLKKIGGIGAVAGIAASFVPGGSVIGGILGTLSKPKQSPASSAPPPPPPAPRLASASIAGPAVLLLGALVLVSLSSRKRR